MKTIDQLKQEQADERKRLVEECGKAGHQWDNADGVHRHKTTEVFTGEYDHFGPLTTLEHHEWTVRTCQRCGFEEYEPENNKFAVMEGRQHWECNPKTGETYLVSGSDNQWERSTKALFEWSEFAKEFVPLDFPSPTHSPDGLCYGTLFESLEKYFRQGAQP